MVKIIPKCKSKADFCGVDEYYYIIRADLACYMRSTNFNHGENLEVFSLHPSCGNGDHYLAHKDDLFYIIKSNYYRRVSNLNTDSGAVVYSLHPNCQGGDHYCSSGDYFYIFFQSRGVYRRTKNMNKDEESEEFTLHPECRNGLYYFGVKDYYYFVRPDDQWGIQYTRCTNFNKNEGAETFSFHTSVYSFLPGGLAVAKGPSFGEWVCIKTISNDSQTPVEWKKQVNKKSGCDTTKISTIEHNWKVSTNVSAQTGGLFKAITQAQFSFTAEHGGVSINTQQENWSEATEIQETITLTMKPHEKIYIFFFQLGLGQDPLLFCRDMIIQDNPTPPTINPLPPAVN